MQTKFKVIIAIFALAAAFASGRYSVNQPKVEQKISDKVDEVKNTAEDTHTTTVIVKKPDGTTVTTIKQDTIAKISDKRDEQTKIDTTITPQKLNTLNVSALVGTDTHELKPLYGISVTKQFLGPITVGGYGLTNGVVGISIGLNF